MKRTALFGAILGLVIGWGAAASAWADEVAGSWRLSITTPEGQTFAPVLKLQKSGEQLSGTFVGDDGSENAITDASFADGELSFSVTLDFGGTPLTTKYRGKVDGSGLSGSLDYDLGGQTGSLDFTGARMLAAADVAGAWSLVATSPDGQTFEPTLELAANGDELSGKYTWIDGTSMDISDTKLNGDELTFRVSLDFGGQAMVVDFKGKVAGDAMTGTADYDLGGQTGTVDFTGTRAGAKLDLAGVWNIVATSPDGQTFEPQLELMDGSPMSGKFTWIDGTSIDVSNIEVKGDTLAVKVEIDFGGQPMVLTFNSKVDGQSMTGTAEYDLGGQTGTVDFTGTKAGEPVKLAGRWNIVVSSPDGQTFEPTVDVVEGPDGISGTFNWIDGTSIEIGEATLDGKHLTFKVALDFGGQAMTVGVDGQVEGKEMAGTVEYDLGGQTGTLDFTATKAEINVGGRWNAVASSPDGQTFEPTIDLEHTGDGIKGTFTWIDGTTIDIKDVKLEGNALAVRVEIDFGGQPMVVVFNSKVDGDQMAGTADYDLGGQTGTIDFTATRGEAAKAECPLAGDWDLTLSTDDGQSFDVQLSVTASGESMSGKYVGPAGEAEVKDLKVDGDHVTFSVTRQRDGTEFTVTYDGKLDGDKLEGTASIEGGGQSGDLKFSGKKSGS